MRPRLPGRDLRALLVVWFAICGGTWAVVVALAVDALDSSGVGAVGAVLAARLIPAFLAAPLTGRLADRHERGRLVAAMAALEAIAFGSAALVVLSGGPFALLLVAAALGGAAGTAPRPALEALMPGLAVSPSELTHATALWSALDNAGFLVGAGVGRVLVAAIGAGAVMGVGSALIAAGAAVALLLPPVAAIEADGDPAAGGLVAEALGGIRALREAPALRTPLLLFAGLLLLEGPTDVLLVVLTIRDLGMGKVGPASSTWSGASPGSPAAP